MTGLILNISAKGARPLSVSVRLDPGGFASVEYVCGRFRGIARLYGRNPLARIRARDICVQRPRKTNFPAHISRFPKSIFLRNKLLIYGHTADCKSPRVYRARFARVGRLTYRAVEIVGSTRRGKDGGEEVLHHERTALPRFSGNDRAGNASRVLQTEFHLARRVVFSSFDRTWRARKRFVSCTSRQFACARRG